MKGHVQKTIYLEKGLEARIKERCQFTKRSFNKELNYVVQNYLKYMDNQNQRAIDAAMVEEQQLPISELLSQ